MVPERGFNENGHFVVCLDCSSSNCGVLYGNVFTLNVIIQMIHSHCFGPSQIFAIHRFYFTLLCTYSYL
jgi:hypothetical protein